MKYHQLVTPAKKNAKRVGRGISAGQGKTAGRGTKGQKSRTGSSRRPGFEGGQNPIMQRTPKLHGFKSLKPKTDVVYTGQLNSLSGTIDAKKLQEAGMIANIHSVKLIVKGELTKKLTVKLPAASKIAVEMIQKAGGTFEKTNA